MATGGTQRVNDVATEELDVVTVGAGFAGLYLLRGIGLSVKVLEAGAGPGGDRMTGADIDAPRSNLPVFGERRRASIAYDGRTASRQFTPGLPRGAVNQGMSFLCHGISPFRV
jgi:cation diffusion facilitator CzcD-associated flavoprotein CzcO